MADAEERDPLRQDPRYEQGMAHFQAGRWQEAIASFEDLLQDHPNSAIIQRALEDARFRTQQDQRVRIRPRQTTIPWRPIVIRVLLVIVIAAVAYQGYQFLDTQIAPALAQAQIDRQRSQLVRECTAFFEGGDLDRAQERCTQLLVEEPGNETAETMLAQIAGQSHTPVWCSSPGTAPSGAHENGLCGRENLGRCPTQGQKRGSMRLPWPRSPSSANWKSSISKP